MVLPHFNPITKSIDIGEPIYNNLSYVEFGNVHLNENCFKIDSDLAFFNHNYSSDDGTFKSLDIIQKYIDENIIIENVEIGQHDKNGNIIARIIVKNFKFVEITNLLDFDWNDNDARYLCVEFKYDSAKHLNEKQYKTYLRKLKMESINNNLD